jgi:copper resistance protein C
MALALRRLVGAAGLAVALLGWAAPAASAHAWLVDLTPADGATPAVVPTEVRLRFSEPVTVPAGRLIVQYVDGRPAAQQASTVSGRQIALALPGGLPGGVYVVTYRATCRDGHVLTGASTFTLPGAGASSRAGTASGLVPVPVGPATAADRTGSGSGAHWEGQELAILAAAVLLVVLTLRRVPVLRRAGPGTGMVAVAVTALVGWIAVPVVSSSIGSGAAASAATVRPQAQRLATREGGAVAVSISTAREQASVQLTVTTRAGQPETPVAVAELTAPGTVLPAVALPLQLVGSGSLRADPVHLPEGGRWQLALTLTHADGVVDRLTAAVEVP